MSQYRTIQGDMPDAIVWRELGETAGLTEALFEANPGLADHGPVLPGGLLLTLPEPPAAPVTGGLRLWD